MAQPTLNGQPKDPQSRIESLEARRDELAKRRFGLETVIKELTRVIQPTSYAYDQAAKAEVKRSVQSIENEIAEIKREEHELGMKVTRAWRRLDEQENNGDGSNLWVKRVTS
jgi:chromosome segregation ATPase